MFTPKQRMLNAYRGLPSDRPPVAPELWYYYPAKFLGVPMVKFERELPFHMSLKAVFQAYQCEGWGLAFPIITNEEIEKTVDYKDYKETTTYEFMGKNFSSEKMYSDVEPSWVTAYPAKSYDDIYDLIDIQLHEKNQVNYNELIKSYNDVGESYLLEVWLGVPFFDFIGELIGFEEATYFFADEEEIKLKGCLKKYMEYQMNFVRKLAENTPFESYMIGCSYSCNSLLGYELWKKWDKPYLKALTDEIHSLGKLLHIHFHGKSIESVEDFAEIGIDCVCPFERPKGGDISTLEELCYVREKLENKVTFNGNVHTIDALINGTPDEIRYQVNEIKLAFEGSNRFIIGSGDQVGLETPHENLIAMIDEAKK